MRPRRPPAAVDRARRPAPPTRPARPRCGREVGGHDHQPGGLERAGAPDRIERVLEVVGAGGDGRARPPAGRRRRSGREASARVPRPSRKRFVWGSVTTFTPAAATSSATRCCSACGRWPRLTQWLAVAGWANPASTARHSSPSPSTVGSSVSSVWRSTPTPKSAATPSRTSVAAAEVVVEMRTAADEVGAGGHGLAQQRPLVGAADAGHRPPAQGDDLDRDEVPESLAHGGEGLDAAQAVLQGDVDVGADRDVAVVRHQSRRPLGPFGDVGDRGQVTARRHRLDRTHQIARRIGDPLGQERLVEVGVRLDRRRQRAVDRRDRSPRRPRRVSVVPIAPM